MRLWYPSEQEVDPSTDPEMKSSTKLKTTKKLGNEAKKMPFEKWAGDYFFNWARFNLIWNP